MTEKVASSHWYLYMLRCNHDTLYTGITTDIEKRFQAHLSGKGAKYTRGKQSLQIVFSTPIGSHSQALKAEAKIKKLPKAKKEKIIVHQCIDFLF